MRKIAVLAAIAVLLSACGFAPVYGDRGGARNVSAALGKVAISNIPDRDGQFLRNHLIDRMYISGRPSDPNAKLRVSLKMTESDLGIQKDATASFRELDLLAEYVLTDKSGKPLLDGKAHSVVGYSKIDAQYGLLAARDNARERALREVGEQIVNRLSLHYADDPDAPSDKPLKSP